MEALNSKKNSRSSSIRRNNSGADLDTLIKGSISPGQKYNSLISSSYSSVEDKRFSLESLIKNEEIDENETSSTNRCKLCEKSLSSIHSLVDKISREDAKIKKLESTLNSHEDDLFERIKIIQEKEQEILNLKNEFKILNLNFEHLKKNYLLLEEKNNDLKNSIFEIDFLVYFILFSAITFLIFILSKLVNIVLNFVKKK